MDVPDPDVLVDRLDSLCAAAKRSSASCEFELYHRSSVTLRVTRKVPGGPDEVQSGRDDGLALRRGQESDERAVFTATAGCDEAKLSWLIEQSDRGYGTPSVAGWPKGSALAIDRDDRLELPSHEAIRSWIDRASTALKPTVSTPARVRVESAAIVETWASSNGARASRTRARAWAIAEPFADSHGRAPLVVAGRSWDSLDGNGWRTLLQDRRWPGEESVDSVSGNWSFVFGPEAAAVLVRALVRALHGPSAPDVKAVGPAWRVSDVPAHPQATGGGTFDDLGQPSGVTQLADGKRVVGRLGGPGTWRRASYRDVPLPDPSFLVVEAGREKLPGRAVVVSETSVHVLGPRHWLLECRGGLLENGGPGAAVRGLLLKVDPLDLVARCASTWGEPRISWLGVSTPALVFLDLRCRTAARSTH